ncbi:MAG: hypothetical protein PHD02_02150 [Bacilli bacterium]|nr:hypothetical protein [Bacilli bacterium]
MKKVWFLVIFLFLFIPQRVEAKEEVRLYLFYSSTCPHCASEEVLLDDLEDKYDNLTVYKYEVGSGSSVDLLQKVLKALDYSTNSVPFTVIGSEYFSGYNDNVGYKIEDAIKYYSGFSHKDVVGEIIGIVPEFVGEESPNQELSDNVSIPILGEVNPKDISLPLVAVILGLIDGFNPCAMWVLVFLITVLIGLNDRKKMWILGITFLVSSAIVYLFFMLAWLNVAIKMEQVRWLQLVIAVIALTAGTININSYFKTADGCNVVDSKKRVRVINQIKKFTSQKSFLLAILGIIGLAFTVNLIELACSAGLPLLFTQILAINNLSKLMYAVNIFIYIFFFLLDDLVVFIIAMITLKVTGISTKYTKYSHLIGGIIMILIAALMLFKPEWLMFNF